MGVHCRACGFENPLGMRFCGNCGAPLRVAPPAEERKLVTVLFVDVVESTRGSAAVDPEQWRERMTQFFAAARHEIERFGGTVEKFIGDAVMAIFGLPAVHEDDPERAARAALAVRERLQRLVDGGLLPGIHMGINTGEVVANPGATEKGEFLVTGDVVNAAARLQQHAQPGEILVGGRTRQALHHIAALERIAPIVLKGRADQIEAWALLDLAPPRARELRATPFVGRTEELALLAGHARRMRREGRGHVITMLGAGGVGKTRLVHELRAQADWLHVLWGRAIPYGTGVPFWALGEAIRRECGILFGDPLDAARQKLVGAAATLNVPAMVPELLAVLGLGGEGVELTRGALFAAMRSFLLAVARRRPLMLIVEDMHSAEDVTLDFLEYAADWVHSAPVLLLVLARPELLERRPGWMGGKRSATTLFLDPLGSEESRSLAREILNRLPAPDSLIDHALDRAGGNPLFLEEILRALIDQRVLMDDGGRWTLAMPMAEVAIPDTVQAVIAARLDALPGAEKLTIQAAAVVGKDFYLGAVRANVENGPVEDALNILIDKDLILRKPSAAIAGEEEFAFRHILIRDVAYGMIPKSLRWPKHTRVAEWLSAIAGDRKPEFADLIAHHWLQVLGLRRELAMPEDPGAVRQAIDYLLVAADRAAVAYANNTALDDYGRAVDLGPSPKERLRALLGRGAVWMLLGQFEPARQDFGALQELAHDLGEVWWEAVALDHIGVSFRRQDQVGPALEHLNRALALSRQAGDNALPARVLNHIGFTLFSDGRLNEAIRAHEEARRMLEGRDLDARSLNDLAESLHGLGENLSFLGRFPESIREMTASIEVSERLGNRALASENRYMVADAHMQLGRYDQAQAEVEQAVATLDEIGDVWNLSFALMVASRVHLPRGEFDKALEYAARGIQLARHLQAIRAAAYNLQGLGIIRRELEDYHGAWQADREAAELAGQVGGAWMPQAQAGLARDAAALGRFDEADAHIREAWRLLNEEETREYFPLDVTEAEERVRIARGQAEVTEAEGRVRIARGQAKEAQEAAKRLADMVAVNQLNHWHIPALLLEAEARMAGADPIGAATLFAAASDEAARIGRPPAQWRALAGLAEAQRALGQTEASVASARRAREIIDRLAASVPDERLRATFMQSSRVQRVAALVGA